MEHENPVADFGQLCLLATFVGCVYAGVVSAVGARRRSRRLVNSGIWATYGVAALLSLAAAVVFFSILSNDYSIKYIQHTSDATMPWYYKLTAFWGGLEASMMLWAWLLALFAALAVWVNRERHRELIPWVITVMMAILAFFLVLLIVEKRPFDTFLTEAPATGKGMNPLLQNPYMAIHPPSLYTGLTSCAVPFAFGMAALITGNLDDSWLRSVRRWVLVSWFFLSLGLILGMLWAYEVLGWGGYWGWDPVEIAGALAWFPCTAFLHSVIVQERRGMLKVWNIFLVITAFLFTMIATFLTRSGIVQSVHAFGQDAVLKWAFAGYIVFAMVLSYGLLIFRMPLLRSRGTLDSWVSREFAFLVNNWILLIAALFLLVAVLFPTLSEWVHGVRINLATPFYSQWMTPIGLILLVLTGVGPLIAWRHATPRNLVDQFTLPVSVGLATMLVLAFVPGMAARTAIFHTKLQLPVALCNFGFCAFVLTTIGQEFYRGTRVRQSHTKLDFFTSLVGLVARNKRRYGGYLIHVAIVLMFVGFAGGAYQKETEVTLEKGQQTQLGAYTVRFLDLAGQDTAEKKIVVADVQVFHGPQLKDLGHSAPAKWFYPHHEEEPVTHVVIGRGLREDLYLVLNGYDPQAGLINLKIVINPLVNWIWIGFILLFFGTVICLLPERAFVLAAQEAKEAAKELAKGGAGGSAALVLVIALAGLALAGGRARADEPAVHHVQEGAMVRAAPKSETEDHLFHRIVCMCGTCGRQLLADCTCSTADHMRGDISRMVAEGKSEEQVVAHYLDKYHGEDALAVSRHGWALSLAVYGVMLIGAGGLVLAALRYRKSAQPAPIPPGWQPAAAAASNDEYAARLDDELDELD